MVSSLRPNADRVQQSAESGAWLRAVGLLLAVLTSGCTSLDYYLQAAHGQFDIWHRQESIERVLARPDLPARLRAKLELVVAARTFARTHLALPDHGSYHAYADLGRDFVVWNVFAAPALSLTPLTSCYPLLGCLEYRGFFAEARARAYAGQLRRQGYDTFVGGVAAYSTLGWFDDPVLSTVLRWDDVRIVDIMFHELAHQRLFVAGDSTFNESFAMAVANAGVELWLADDQSARTRHALASARNRQLIDLVFTYRERLAMVFTGRAEAATKRTEKSRLYAELHARYQDLKATWGGDDSYDEWMDTDLNNAKLASLATYQDDVGAFLSILHRYDDDFPRFYAAVARLAALAPATRTRCLRALATTSLMNANDCDMVFR